MKKSKKKRSLCKNKLVCQICLALFFFLMTLSEREKEEEHADHDQMQNEEGEEEKSHEGEKKEKKEEEECMICFERSDAFVPLTCCRYVYRLCLSCYHKLEYPICPFCRSDLSNNSFMKLRENDHDNTIRGDTENHDRPIAAMRRQRRRRTIRRRRMPIVDTTSLLVPLLFPEDNGGEENEQGNSNLLLSQPSIFLMSDSDNDNDEEEMIITTRMREEPVLPVWRRSAPPYSSPPIIIPSQSSSPPLSSLSLSVSWIEWFRERRSLRRQLKQRWKLYHRERDRLSNQQFSQILSRSCPARISREGRYCHHLISPSRSDLLLSCHEQMEEEKDGTIEADAMEFEMHGQQ